MSDKPNDPARRYTVEIRNLRVESLMARFTRPVVCVVDTQTDKHAAEYLNTPTTALALWRADRLARRLNRYA